MPTKKVAKHSTVPPKKIVTVAAIALSVTLNVIFLAGLIVTKTGALDYAVVNSGINVLCSDSFREKVAAQGSKSAAANIDYECQRNNAAEKYYLQGFNDYLKSQGLPVDTNAN